LGTLPKNNDPRDRRRYIRLDHIFPVEFRFMDTKGNPVSSWYQAYTQDVGSGGLCLTVNHIEFGDVKYLADKDSALALHINIPLGAQSVQATARLSWFKTTRTEPSLQYVLGVFYEKIDDLGNKRILRYARVRKMLKAVAITGILFLSIALVGAGFYNARLRYENEKLLASLSVNVAHQKALKQDSGGLKVQIEEMKFLLSQSQRKAEVLQRLLRDLGPENPKASAELQGSLDFFKKYQEKIQSDMTSLIAKKTKVDDDVTAKAQEASLLGKKIRDKLYRWISTHQNVTTGLVVSFEGDKDVGDWGFTYDQALAVMVFAKGGDTSRAAAILDFFLKAPQNDRKGFFNAYYASSGAAAEYVVHAGPNIWLGLAILQYTEITADKKYIPMAEDIGRWLETVKDAQGGLRGGTEFSWYSTEHNLDVYSFYTMLFKITKNPRYQTMAEATLAWLNKNAYSKIAMPPVKRGKGDATIATDTYAWSVTALGPDVLQGAGMDPDAIMEFAINNCSVSVEYAKPEGNYVKVKGFDFAKHQNMARGGVVSCEWSSQMILALKIMADYHAQRDAPTQADFYRGLANEYTSELSKMIITSPSPVGQGDFCLPYASHEFADTGHGWRTPKGSRTGSVAATAYAILAIDGFNPLKLDK
jgi:hypothetical protein